MTRIEINGEYDKKLFSITKAISKSTHEFIDIFEESASTLKSLTKIRKNLDENQETNIKSNGTETLKLK